MATFPLILVLVAVAPTTIPFVLPTAVFSTTKLLLPDKIPMPKSSLGVAKPFPLVSFQRSELLLPRIHIPPQGKPGWAAPFLTAILAAMLIRDAVGPTRMPDRQLVVTVTPSTLPTSVPTKRMPSARKRCTTPGPRTSTSV